MRNAAIVVVMLLVMLLVTRPVFGDQSAQDPKLTVRFGALRSAQKDPYGKLFNRQEELKRTLEQALASMPKTRVVCGMTIIEADPAIDPKMGVSPKKDAGVEHKIRAIDPPICNPAK